MISAPRMALLPKLIWPNEDKVSTDYNGRLHVYMRVEQPIRRASQIMFTMEDFLS